MPLVIDDLAASLPRLRVSYICFETTYSIFPVLLLTIREMRVLLTKLANLSSIIVALFKVTNSVFFLSFEDDRLLYTLP